ncbi:MAG TPA: AraC family transcriptional regulator [Puia sp.]|nr:AraC family transcriptional regulator [Puia sp.]
MIFHEFPDLGWLKSQIADGFSNRRGWGNLPLDTKGFPSVIIQTTVRECFRPDIKGPFSFFLNLRGNSLCSVDGQRTRIDEDNYFVTNRSQAYTLQIEEKAHRTETFNIHFGEFFSESVFHSLVTPADRILDYGTEIPIVPVVFFNQLHRRDRTFNAMIRAIQASDRDAGKDRLRFEEQLVALLSYHLQQHEGIARVIDRLPLAKKATRIEVYRRLARAMDMLRVEYCGEISLDRLAAAACFSKYHFLRLFRAAYGLSPFQYVQHLRIQKASELLAGSGMVIADIAGQLGFGDGQSFSRLFFQRMGMYPSSYRQMARR